ncbi:PilZ domain-containing protein [Actinomarinicola tropica]|uniref:PilZ domain-containing protein n=1 Tax=Actinomarinicola tropica TaxID=2789776 RepID=A0A5Q2RIS4_9ACTN|nr:PilZ domain-containing protein [Actinomarinicola tropica]QGG96679.1 hypothetical protein GH723_17120 [Actinomarinicola tropica]
MDRERDTTTIHLSNRRIGHRVRPENLEVLWCLPGTVVGHRREKKRPPTGRVVDLSFTGMQVVAPLDKRIGRGTTIEVVLEGMTVPVRVRWIGEADEPGMGLHGVEMLHQSPDLTRLLTSIIEACDIRDGVELREPPPVRQTLW